MSLGKGGPAKRHVYQSILLSSYSLGQRERPIVFVGHSLGGLVIKEVN